MSWLYFRMNEFPCKHCGLNKMRPEFISRLDALRHRCGFPLPVMSGYRCPIHNQNTSTTGPNGPHTTGRAVDVLVDRARAFDLTHYAFAMGFTGLGFKQHGANRFIHLDDLGADYGPRPTIWTYP